MADDDGLLVHAELVFHEGQPDGPPGCDRIRHVTQDTREPGDLIQPLYFKSSSKTKGEERSFFTTLLTQEYQLALVTSPDPLPGTITALTALDMAGGVALRDKNIFISEKLDLFESSPAPAAQMPFTSFVECKDEK